MDLSCAFPPMRCGPAACQYSRKAACICIAHIDAGQGAHDAPGKGPDNWHSTQDTYQRLTFKTVAFWTTVSSQYSVKYVVKVDDDSYVRLDRLTIALGQWAEMGSGKPSCACSAEHCRTTAKAVLPAPPSLNCSAALQST